ncbi:MAG: preprotein translocase subunit SecE [Gammaproteobacteria bacterium]|jgi:preprotein translocase subunit SecE
MAAAKQNEQGSAFDTVKLAVAVLLLLVAIGGFYYYAEASLLYRVLGLLGVTAVALGIGATTMRGRLLLGFLQDSRTEVRKVVWPTRTETTQTTLVVIGMVLVLGLFLWLLDMFLGWAVQFLIHHGG